MDPAMGLALAHLAVPGKLGPDAKTSSTSVRQGSGTRLYYSGSTAVMGLGRVKTVRPERRGVAISVRWRSAAMFRV